MFVYVWKESCYMTIKGYVTASFYPNRDCNTAPRIQLIMDRTKKTIQSTSPAIATPLFEDCIPVRAKDIPIMVTITPAIGINHAAIPINPRTKEAMALPVGSCSFMLFDGFVLFSTFMSPYTILIMILEYLPGKPASS